MELSDSARARGLIGGLVATTVTFFMMDITLRLAHAAVDESYGILDARRMITSFILSVAIFGLVVWPTGVVAEFAYPHSRMSFVRFVLLAAVVAILLSAMWSLFYILGFGSSAIAGSIPRILEYVIVPAVIGCVALVSLTFLHFGGQDSR